MQLGERPTLRLSDPGCERHSDTNGECGQDGSWQAAPNGNPDLILIASVSEVELIVEARQKLLLQGRQVRIVSMPSWELFDAQTLAYRNRILPPAIGARLAVEAGVSQGWHRYVGSEGDVIAIDRFGASAPGDVMMQEFGFTADNICKCALALLK